MLHYFKVSTPPFLPLYHERISKTMVVSLFTLEPDSPTPLWSEKTGCKLGASGSASVSARTVAWAIEARIDKAGRVRGRHEPGGGPDGTDTVLCRH